LKRNSKSRIFFTSFFVTICLIALVLGFAEVDYQCRRIGFGDNKTLISQITGKNLLISCNTGGICYNNSI
jgi:hypothetical protein